jgi:hypothetical protein
MAAKLEHLATALRQRMHAPVAQVGEWLKRVVLGYYLYQAVPAIPARCTASVIGSAGCGGRSFAGAVRHGG